MAMTELEIEAIFNILSILERRVVLTIFNFQTECRFTY